MTIGGPYKYSDVRGDDATTCTTVGFETPVICFAAPIRNHPRRVGIEAAIKYLTKEGKF